MNSLTIESRSVTADAIALLAEAEQNLKTARLLVGQTIAARRHALDLDLRQCARLANVDPSELSRLERGTVGGRSAIAGSVDVALTTIERERAGARLEVA
jgi:hypothetical protein